MEIRTVGRSTKCPSRPSKQTPSSASSCLTRRMNRPGLPARVRSEWWRLELKNTRLECVLGWPAPLPWQKLTLKAPCAMGAWLAGALAGLTSSKGARPQLELGFLVPCLAKECFPPEDETWTSLTGPWLKTRTLAEPGVEWLKHLTLGQESRPTWQQFCVYHLSCAIFVRHLTRVRSWRRWKSQTCMRGHCCGVGWPFSECAGTSQQHSTLACDAGLVLRPVLWEPSRKCKPRLRQVCRRPWENPLCNDICRCMANQLLSDHTAIYENGDGSFLDISCVVRMTIHGRAWNSIRPATTPGCHGTSPCHFGNGSGDVGEILISAMTKTVASGEGMSGTTGSSRPGPRPKLRERPEAWPRVKLPPPVEEEVDVIGLVGPVEHNTQAPHVEGPHRRVVNYNTFARRLDCHRQTGKVKGKFNFSYLKGQECRPLKKHFRARQDPPA
eukprot:6292638-Amphidinium_carterae.1